MISRILSPLRQVLALLVMACCVTHCGQREPGAKANVETERSSKTEAGRQLVYFSLDRLDNPMRAVQTSLLNRLVITRPRMDFRAEQCLGQPDLQARQIRQALEEGASVIVVFPVQPTALEPILLEAVGRGVKVISLAPGLSQESVTTAITLDQKSLGRAAGEYVLTALRRKAQAESLASVTGRIVELRGDEYSAAAEERAAGFAEAIQQEPGVLLVHDAPANWNDLDAADRTVEALRLQKPFDVVFAHNDLIAHGASEMITQHAPDLRDHVLIMGMDGLPGKNNGIELVIFGDLDATLSIPVQVDVAWRLITRMIDDSDFIPDKAYALKPTIVTQENANEVARLIESEQ